MTQQEKNDLILEEIVKEFGKLPDWEDLDTKEKKEKYIKLAEQLQEC